MQLLPKLTEEGTVDIIRVLKTGELIRSLDEYRQVAERFTWEDRKQILSKLLHLKKLTDNSKRSVIAIYEDGRQIREFANVEQAFLPLAFC